MVEGDYVMVIASCCMGTEFRVGNNSGSKPDAQKAGKHQFEGKALKYYIYGPMPSFLFE